MNKFKMVLISIVLILMLITIVNCSRQDYEIQKASYLSGYKTFISFYNNRIKIEKELRERIDEIIDTLKKQKEDFNKNEIKNILNLLDNTKANNIRFITTILKKGEDELDNTNPDEIVQYLKNIKTGNLVKNKEYIDSIINYLEE